MHATTANTRRGVTLRHTLADGAVHFDWMLEDPAAPPGDGRLVAFRVDRPMLTWPTDHPIYIERIADHRRAYLDYQGEVSGNRGRVERVEAFTFTAQRWAADAGRLNVVCADWRGAIELTAENAADWRARRLVD